MTLDTTIYVHDEIDRWEVFSKCREMLGATEVNPHEDGEGWRGDGSRCLENRLGQGLPAWLRITYRESAPLRPETTFCTDCGEDDACSTRCSQIATYLEVGFEMAYSYRDDEGRGPGDLHACYVVVLGQWLDERGVTWSWRNEFTGDIHGGDERYRRLPDLMRGGADAADWFANIVLPVISAESGGVEPC
jgi:hypothetical protein